ncbi:MAG: VCBS repeat-containing protein [Propionicimonas sp.]|uniref:FG-GAP repeat domain-containing protein n=1 Tax=Propionicimonas sp. TaxID=1955623 RepID=UPI003D0FB0B9
MNHGRVTTALVVGIGLTLTSLATCTPTGSAEPSAGSATGPTAATASTASPDFDGDGNVDYVILGSVGDGFGEVVVRYGSGGELTLSTQVTIAKASGDVSHPLARDLNADGYTDLAFTARGSANGVPDELQLGVVFGSASGLDLGTLHVNAVPAVDAAHAESSLELLAGPVPRLVVGATTTLESGKSGVVVLYPLDADGLPSGDPVVLRPGADRIPKLTDRGSFGTSLASSGNQLFVGAPYAKVGSTSETGAVTEIVFGASGVTSAKVVTQATKGVSGAPGTHDRFGYSLAARDGSLAVGAPGDRVGGVARTGSVQLFTVRATSVTPAGRLWQGTTGVPGRAEAHDLFGSSVELGQVCTGVPAVVVGGPDEVIVRGHDADGSVWVIPVKTTTSCPARQFWEGHGIAGQPTDSRSLGSSVAVVRQAGERADRILMAGPGSFSQGPDGVLAIWSAETLSPLHYEHGNVDAVAGR